MVGDVEKVGRAKVLVSLRIASDQCGDVNRGLDRRELRVFGRVDDGARDAGELSSHFRQHHVPDAELGQAVAWVDVPDRPGLDDGRDAGFDNGSQGMVSSCVRRRAAERRLAWLIATATTLALN